MRVGSTASNQGGALHQVDRVEVSDVFNAQQYANDVALVHLATPVSFNDRVRAIRLTARGLVGQAVPGSHVTVAGWGTGKLVRRWRRLLGRGVWSTDQAASNTSS